MADGRERGPEGALVERRARQPLLYTPDQLLGRTPIRFRRKADKRRFAAHLLAVILLVGLSLWWVVPLHAFAGPVLLTLTRTHGVHVGDLPTLVFLALAARSLVVARRLAAPR
jgi:hypothetical protein